MRMSRRSSRSRCRAGRSRGSSTSSSRSTDGRRSTCSTTRLTKDQILRFSYRPVELDEQEPRHRRVQSAGARVPASLRRTTSSASRRAVRSAGGPSPTSRLELNWTRTASHASVEAPTIQVTDAFTSGGAQIAGGRHDLDFEFASDIDYIRGIHSIRAGVLLEGGSFRTDDASNYLGTYSFTSLAAYDAGQPATFTVRIGNPLVEYRNVNAGLYVQDDIRIRKGLTLSPGAAVRSANARLRLQQPRAEIWRHMGAVQERQDDAACERGRFLQLAQRGRLRADPARRRLQAAGADHRRPGLSGAKHRWDRAAGQPLSAQSRPQAAAQLSHQRRHRSGADVEDPPRDLGTAACASRKCCADRT